MSDAYGVLSPYLPDLDALELLTAIGRTGSLARVGAERGTSQPAVSLRVKSLERQVGVRLVERGPGGSRLTTEGALLVDWARSVLQSAAQLDAGIASLRNQRDTQLRVAASLTIAEHLLPGWLQLLRDSRPGTAVSLVAVNSTLVAELVLHGEVALGFVEGPTVPAGLATRKVGGDELVLVAAAGSPLARRRHPVAAEELASMPLVEREAGSGTRAAFDAAVAASGHQATRPVPLLEVSSTTAVRSAVMAGVGAAVVSSLAIREDLAGGRLVGIPVQGLDLHRDLRAIWVRGSSPLGSGRDLLAIASR